jgi:chromosome segregation ATPase
MGSHVNVTASQRIEIKRMQGSENKLTIDPLAVESIDENVDEKEKELDMLDERLRFLKKEIERYKIVLQNNESSYLEVKKKLIHYKKNNIAMPDAFVKSFKQYQKYEQHLKDLLSEENVKKEQREVINMAINSIQNNIYTARVINRDRWVGYNEIRFKLIDPPMDVVYAPHEGSLEKIFALVKTENDEYIIKAVKE